jgi:hypothetical protein
MVQGVFSHLIANLAFCGERRQASLSESRWQAVALENSLSFSKKRRAARKQP